MNSVPRWNGQPETLEDFADKVQDWIYSHKKDDRTLLGPRLRQAMPEGSQQYAEAKKVPLEELTGEKGAQAVLECLRRARGPTSLQEAVSQVRKLWRGVSRERGEGMRAWTSRFEIYVRKVGKALHSAVPEIEEQNWLHPLLLGIQLLEGTGLDPSEEAAVLACSGLGNSYLFQDLVNALTNQWSDSQVAARDAVKYKTKGRSSNTNATTTDESNDYPWTAEPAWYADGDQATESYDEGDEDCESAYWAAYPGYNEEEEELSAAVAMVEVDAEEWRNDESAVGDAELHDAAATMASAARTFQEARALLNSVKEARGYFPIVGLGAYQPGQRMVSTAAKGKSKTKGKGKTKGRAKGFKGPARRTDSSKQQGQPWAGAPPDPKARAASFAGKCLLCGQYGHRAAQCTNRTRDGQPSAKKPRPSPTTFVGMVGPRGAGEDAVEDEFSGFSMDSCRGLGLLDGGASTSVGGVSQLQVIQDALDQEAADVYPRRKHFQFAGGDETWGETCFRIRLPGLDDLELSICVVDRPSPILLGIDMLTSFGIVIDYEQDQVYSKRLGRVVPSVRLPSGHLALDLLKMMRRSPEGLPSYPFSEEPAGTAATDVESAQGEL